jgi:HEAT repeat protein
MDQAQLAPAYRVVVLIILALGMAALAFCVILVAHHGVTSVRRRRRAVLVQRATPFLAAHVATGQQLRMVVAEARRRYGDWATAIVLREARRELRGGRADRLTAALLDMGEVARLIRLLHSHQHWRRPQAAHELGQCGGDEARDALLEATTDRAPVVRRAARDGLLADGRPSSIKAAIVSYLEDAPSGTTWRRSFYARLAAVSPEDLRSLLASGALGRQEEKLALEALGEARVAEALPLARERLADADPELRATAGRVVGKLADQASMPALTGLLRDPEWFVRAAAAKAFAGLDADDEALRGLHATLSDETWWVRVNAAHALAQQGDRGLETLLAAVDGDDPFSRDAGLAALGQAVMTPAARKRFEGSLLRLPADSPVAPLRRLLESVGSQPAPAGTGGAPA